MAYDVDREPGKFVSDATAHQLRRFYVFSGFVVFAVVMSIGALVAGLLGVLPALGLLGVALIARAFADDRLDAAVPWMKGRNAEVAIGGLLNELRQEGFVVMHDLDKVVPGNVDHLVSGPTGVFMIETKFKRYQHSDLAKAKSTAKRIADELGVTWVQPVICCATREYGPIRDRRVAIVGRNQLLPYLRSARYPVIEFDRLATFADRQ